MIWPVNLHRFLMHWLSTDTYYSSKYMYEIMASIEFDPHPHFLIYNSLWLKSVKEYIDENLFLRLIDFMLN